MARAPHALCQPGDLDAVGKSSTRSQTLELLGSIFTLPTPVTSSAMLCAISGEAPEEPVVSKKTGSIVPVLKGQLHSQQTDFGLRGPRPGTVYEKRLIEKYIEEHGKEPGTEDELDIEDLLPVKTARIVRPRPPTLTSIPALLAAFQNEWDALALETYNLQEQLARTREELATALYQHDAAVRVIARLTKERDEARDSLSKVTVSGGTGANGDAMAIDNEGLPEDLANKVDETHQRLVPSMIRVDLLVTC